MLTLSAGKIPEVWTVTEFAEWRKCSGRTVERITHDPRFPKPLPGPGRKAWFKDDVLEYFRTHAVGNRGR